MAQFTVRHIGEAFAYTYKRVSAWWVGRYWAIECDRGVANRFKVLLVLEEIENDDQFSQLKCEAKFWC